MPDVNTISGETRLAAVVGHPVRHSLSPRIHNAAFEASGLDWSYLALDVPTDQGAYIVEAMRTLGIAGMSVTMPHKVAVMEAADVCSPTAMALGAANCLYWRDEQIVADSTDGDGFAAAFTEQFEKGFEQRSVAVIGAGGAARSIVEAVGRHGASEIVVVNRSQERQMAAVALASQARPGSAADAAGCEVIVNGTAVGMSHGPAPGESPIQADLLTSGHIVVDIVYNPLKTPLLTAAAARGAKTQGGVAMLVHQAALAFRHWTGQEAPLGAMTAAVAPYLLA